MWFRHWFPPHDTTLAVCNSDIVTVRYSFWLFVFCVVFVFFLLLIFVCVFRMTHS